LAISPPPTAISISLAPLTLTVQPRSFWPLGFEGVVDRISSFKPFRIRVPPRQRSALETNYRFERSERDRSKQAKKEEKARRQQERTSQRKSHEAGQFVLPIATDDER
jgi:hypothetical protein